MLLPSRPTEFFQIMSYRPAASSTSAALSNISIHKATVILLFHICGFLSWSPTYLSKALTLASNFLLFLQLIRTWVLFLTDWVKTDSGPVLNSSCSRWDSSSGVISLFGFANRALDKYKYNGCHKSSDKYYFMCNSFFFLLSSPKKLNTAYRQVRIKTPDVDLIRSLHYNHNSTKTDPCILTDC